MWIGLLSGIFCCHGAIELSTEYQHNQEPSDSNMDYMTTKDTGQESDPHAGHKMSDIHATHDLHAGHSVAMFRDKFWLSFALTIPVVFWSADVQHWLGYTAPTFPGSKFIRPILGTVVFVYGGLVFIRGAWGELADRKPGMMTLISLGIIAALALRSLGHSPYSSLTCGGNSHH